LKELRNRLKAWAVDSRPTMPAPMPVALDPVIAAARGRGRDAAARYLGAQAGLRGEVLGQREAVAAAKGMFGSRLSDASPCSMCLADEANVDGGGKASSGPDRRAAPSP
jgi:hypothetical protein